MSNKPSRKSKQTKKAQLRANKEKKTNNRVDRMWAEDGMVKIIDVEGKLHVKTVKQAAHAANELNKMFPAHISHKAPTALREDIAKTHTFVERIIKTCREAKAQREIGGSDKAKKLDNLFSGLTPDGQTAKEQTLDQAMQTLAIVNHTLTEQEIVTVMTNATGTREMKEDLLMKMHSQRVTEQAAGAVESHQRAKHQ